MLLETGAVLDPRRGPHLHMGFSCCGTWNLSGGAGEEDQQPLQPQVQVLCDLSDITCRIYFPVNHEPRRQLGFVSRVTCVLIEICYS